MTYGVVNAGTFALTQRLDGPNSGLPNLNRNRYITGGLALAGGIALAFASLPLGIGVAGGALVTLFGTDLTLALGKLVDLPLPGAKVGSVYGNMGGYEAMNGYERQLGGYTPIGSVYGQMGQAYGQIGDVIPAPPWQSANPF